MRYVVVTEMVGIAVYNVVDYTFMCCVCGLYFRNGYHCFTYYFLRIAIVFL